MESSGAPTYEENLVDRLARSLERSGFTSSTVVVRVLPISICPCGLGFELSRRRKKRAGD